MSTENDNEKITEADVDKMIRGYGRGASNSAKVSAITKIMNIDFDEYREAINESEAKKNVDQVQAQVEEVELEEEQDDDFA
jgi:hypothetical protein